MRDFVRASLIVTMLMAGVVGYLGCGHASCAPAPLSKKPARSPLPEKCVMYQHGGVYDTCFFPDGSYTAKGRGWADDWEGWWRLERDHHGTILVVNEKTAKKWGPGWLTLKIPLRPGLRLGRDSWEGSFRLE